MCQNQDYFECTLKDNATKEKHGLMDEYLSLSSSILIHVLWSGTIQRHRNLGFRGYLTKQAGRNEDPVLKLLFSSVFIFILLT